MRIIFEGFLGAFVLGFTGTAFPRLTGNRTWFGGEFCALLLLWTLAVASHAAGQVAAGDSAFSVMVLTLFVGMAGRSSATRTLPNPRPWVETHGRPRW